MISVLYVDDEPGLLEIAKLFLERGGQFFVDTVISAPEALQRLKSVTYDAIISDYLMPGMNGIEFLRQIRTSGNIIPFIIFTGRGREEIVIQALNEGADFYLQKGGDPVSQFAELAHHVRQAVQQRRAEMSIRDLERREADIISFLPDATFAIDKRGVVIAWNRAMEEMTGVRASQMLGMGNYEYALPFYHERRPILIDLVLKDDPATAARYPYIKKEGGTLFSETTIPHFNDGRGASIWFTASPLYDREGNVIGAIESVRDITERKRAEESLVAANKEYTGLLDQIQDVYYRSDTEGRLVKASRSWAKLLGYADVSECIGRSIADDFYCNPEDRKRFLEEVYRHGKVTDYEVCIRQKNGTPVLVSTSSHLYYDTAGKVLGVEGTFKDITEQKEQEHILRAQLDLGLALQKTHGLNETLDACLSAAIGISGMDSGGIYLVDRTSGSVDLAISHNLSDAFAESVSHYPAGSPNARMVMAEKPVFVLYSKTGIVHTPVQEREGLRAAGIIPIILGGNVTGCLNVASHTLDEVLPSARVALETIATQIGTAIERVRSEDALSASEERYRNVVEDQTELICRFLPDGTHVFVNTAYCRYFGLDCTGIIGKKFFASLPPGDAERFRQHFASFSAERPIAEIEHRVILPDGSTRWMQWIDRAIFHAEGNLTEFQSVGRDITGFKRAENALRESEERYRNVVEDQTEFISRFLPDGTHVFVNEAYCRYFGFTREGILGHKFRPATPPEDQERVQQFFASLTPDHPVDTIEHRIVMPDGRIRWQRWSDRAIFGPSGTILEYQSVGRDITEIKEAEEALKESERRFRSLFEKSVEPQLLIDSTGNVTDCNDAFLALFDLHDKDLVIGHSPLEFAPPVQPDGTPSSDRGKEIMREVLRNGSARFEWAHQKHDAEHTPIMTELLLTLVPLAGRPMVHVAIRDITDRKKAETDLRAAYEHLAASDEELRQQYDELARVQQALREGEQQLKNFMQHLPIGIFRTTPGPSGRRIMANPILAQVHGFDSMEEFMECPIADLYADPAERRKFSDRLVREGRVSDIELHLRKKNGELFWASLSAIAVPGPGGETEYFDGVIEDITDRKLAEEALKESEEKYRLLAETSPDMVYFIDPDGFVRFVNSKAAEVFRAEPGDLTGKHLMEIFPPDAAGHHLDGIRRVVTTRLPVRHEIQDDLPSGRLWIEVRLTPVIGADGTVIGVLGISRDITERKKTEEALRESEEKFRIIFKTQQIGIMMIDAGTHAIVDANPYAVAHIGLPRDQIIGRICHDFVCPAQYGQCPITDCGQTVDHAERVLITADKTEVPVIKTVAVMDIGAKKYLIESFTDISELKQAGRALQESEERFRELTDLLPQPVYEIDNSGRITFANRFAFKAFGYTREEFDTGLYVAQMIHPDDRDRALQNIRRILDGERIPGTEYRALRKDGMTFPVIIYGDRIIRKNQIVGLRGIIADISEQKEAEEALRESEGKYRELFSSITDAVFVHDFSGPRPGNFVEVSNNACRMLGYTREELLRLSPLDLNAPESGTDLKTVAEKLMSGKDVIFEQILVTSGKQRIPVEIHSHVFMLGGRRSVVSLVHDITGRRKAEADLRESEERFRRLISRSFDAIAVHQDGRIVLANDAAARILGAASIEELVGRSLLDLIHPEFRAIVAERARQILQSPEVTAPLIEEKFVRTDGNVVDVEVMGTATQHEGRPAVMVVFRDITERKRVEEALRESEEKFRTIVDTTSEWIWEIDADGRHTYSNPAVESLLGYTPDEFLGLSAFDFMHPEDRERIGAIFPSFVNEKKGWRNLVIRWRHRDGTYRYLESNAIPVFDERGGLAGFRGADRDITERMRTEEILRQANLVVENSPVVVFRWKAVEGWPVAYVSNNVTRFGYMPEELLLGTVPYAKIVHPDDLVRVADEVQKYSAEAVDQFRQEYRIVTRDGGVRWVDDRTVIERDSTGAITHYQGIIIDITERKAAEEALRESEEKYRTLVESTADMVWEVDRDGRYVYVSPVIRTLLGFEPGEVIGRTPFDLMAPDEAERVKRIFSEYAGSGKPIVRLENTNIQRDGHPVILETSGEPVFDASGNLTGYRGIDRDITERKRAEEALRQAHRQLTLMTGITRHDILNNITVMLGFLEVAKGKSSHPEMREFIDRLETKTGQIQSLIEFTRIYQDLGTQKPQWQDIHAVLSRLKVPPGISLAVTCAGTEVFADAMLERVFYNLVDNSVRHGEHVTGISVTRQETASGLVIVFTDNGAGIPADEKEKIFDRGYGRNSGLGLFLAREVLALTGITISETGAPGEGARFEISVPRGKYRFTGGQGR